MRTLLAIAVATVILSPGVQAQETRIGADVCEIPSYLLSSDNTLGHVAQAAKDQREIRILVIGTGSSLLAGPPGTGNMGLAYPGRLEAALRRRLPDLKVTVDSQAKPRQTTVEMASNIEKMLQDRKPSLVIWQAGTVDAMRGVDPEEFRGTLEDGVEKLQAGGADVILMNMQYSPRTEAMIALGPYADNMRAVARDREIPLFDRLGIMRHWNDNGAFDLNATSKDPALAQRVHECLGRALASLVIESAHLSAADTKASQ